MTASVFNAPAGKNGMKKAAFAAHSSELDYPSLSAAASTVTLMVAVSPVK